MQQKTFNALEMHITSAGVLNDGVLLLLYAAGEKLMNEEDYSIPDVLQHKDEQLTLMHICRQIIRKHLINLNPHFPLFRIVPLLGLPRPVTAYLLFDKSLD